MSTNKKIPLAKKLAKKISETTVQSKDELFLWKATIVFILILMTFSIIYFIRLGYYQTNALLDKTTETVVNKSGYSLENINMDALQQAAVLIEYKKNPLTLPSKIRNMFFYGTFEETPYQPLEVNKDLSSSVIKTAGPAE
jgi:hypothetical protein